MTDRAQVDLFLDQLVDAPFKDERSLMEFPFFSLQKRPRPQPFVYDDGRVQIRIEPGPKGMATIYDKDVLIYVTSILNDRLERGLGVERTVRFAAHDFLRSTGRSTSARGYELLQDALHRLRSTNIITNIKAGGESDTRGFGWIEDWRILRRTSRSGRKLMAGVEVTLNRWMFTAIVQDRRVLTIHPDYFQLQQGLERRLYELARKHVARTREWRIDLAALAEKCGSLRELRKFKAEVKAIAGRDAIPDYSLSLEEGREVAVVFSAKAATRCDAAESASAM